VGFIAEHRQGDLDTRKYLLSLGRAAVADGGGMRIDVGLG